MSPDIVIKNDLYFIGKKIIIIGTENYYKEIPLFWQKWCNEAYSDFIIGDIDRSSTAGICITVNDSCLEYLIGHLVSPDITVPDGYELYKIPSTKYAAFTVTGPLTESVQKTWDYIWGTWLLGSGYCHSEKPEIEYYYSKDGEYIADIYLPIL